PMIAATRTRASSCRSPAVPAGPRPGASSNSALHQYPSLHGEKVTHVLYRTIRLYSKHSTCGFASPFPGRVGYHPPDRIFDKTAILGSLIGRGAVARLQVDQWTVSRALGPPDQIGSVRVRPPLVRIHT